MSDKKQARPQQGETLRPDQLDSTSDSASTSDPNLETTDALYQPSAARQRQAASALPAQIPGFQVLEELGRGAFGVVYRAIDTQLDRQVAIKLPLLHDAQLRDRYIAEARNAAKVESGGIVPVFQVGTTDEGQPFVVQKLIQGETLEAILKREGSLPAGQTAELVLKISQAIAGAHSAGLVHRDLKPANILVDQDGVPWVADFGLAVFEEEQRNRRGELAGTPIYMSPEQLQGRADWLDGRADIWAIGIILYELLSSKPPFEASNIEELKDQILHKDPRPLNQRSPHIPVELDLVFRNCCAKEVSDRFSSAHELAIELEAFLESWPDEDAVSTGLSKREAATVSRRRGPPSVGAHRSRSRVSYRSDVKPPGHKAIVWKVASGLAIALIAVIGAAIWFGRQQPTPPTPAQILVSLSGAEGTYGSIASALQVAEAGSKIAIAPGEYRENLEINQDVTLSLEDGQEAGVRIIGEGAPAITLLGESHLKLVNLTLDTEVVGGEGINTIELQGGSLQLEGCQLVATSFDCVQVNPGAELIAHNCQFQSAGQPAVFAKRAQDLRFHDCRFEIQVEATNSHSDDARVQCGVQALECGGTISSCHFFGSGTATGIELADTKSTVKIQACTVEGLQQGIAARNCTDLQIVGEPDKKNHLVDCETGIVLEQCQGTIENSYINCRNTGVFATGRSVLNFVNTTVSGSKDVGIRIDNSNVRLSEPCKVSDNGLAGILVNGGHDALETTNCIIGDNGVGVVIVSGTTRLVGGSIHDNQAAILVAPPEQLGQSQANLVPVSVSASGVEFKGNKQSAEAGVPATGILFKTTGRYQLRECEFFGFGTTDQPALDAGLIAETRDDGITYVINQP